MTDIVLVFPNQLFKQHPCLRDHRKKVSTRILLFEDSLFFADKQYPLSFHKQKLAYHRATMDAYQKSLLEKGWVVERISFKRPQITVKSLCQKLARQGATQILCAELNDFMVKKRLSSASAAAGLEFAEIDGPGFLNSVAQNTAFRATKKRWFMADFYQWQRKRLDILIDDNKPRGGQWSLDAENRKKLPRQDLARLPVMPAVRRTAVIKKAIDSIERDFPENPGSLATWIYPTTHKAADQWLQVFLEERFDKFGAYEDAIAADENWLYHSVLTPMLNTGLLTPQQILDKAMLAADEYQTPLNSVEGFVRQIIGWREFMRATYHDLGVGMRTSNYWQHKRPIPKAFYTASTGIDPVDNTINRVLQTGYCHHIERLMVLGGFMFLCEIHPDHIYQWFMEMFIDSYDWVMVPNVYAMSQHADGGSITTKPYFSGSNYIIKMSHYKRGDWSEIWDALFWRWIAKNAEQLKGNPRWAMMVSNVRKKDKAVLNKQLQLAESFLESLA